MQPPQQSAVLVLVLVQALALERWLARCLVWTWLVGAPHDVQAP